MTLDPQVAALLQALPAPDPASPRSVMAMRSAAAAALPSMEQVHSIEDRVATTTAGDLRVRIYRPADRDGLPVVVFLHGGGFALGSLESHDDVCRVLANRSGCVIVSVDYRLAPEHPFPTAAEDAHAAVAWVAEHATELGGDPARLAVAGDSAGGNLAAVVALMARDRNGPSLAFQLLIYPMIEHDFDGASLSELAEGHFLTRSDLDWFWGLYLGSGDARQPYASPLRAENLAGLPPALVVTAEYDPLKDEGQAYAHRLGEAGVRVESRCYPGLIHGFASLRAFVEQGAKALDEVADALGTALSAPGT